MALTLSGDDGVAGVNGSATTPAIQGTDTNTGLTFGTDTVNVVTGGSTRSTVDSSGRLLVGTSTARTNPDYFGTAITPQIQLEGTTTNGSTFSLTANSATDSVAPQLRLGKSSTGSVGGNGAVANNEVLGSVVFSGNDGTDFLVAAEIFSACDGTPSTKVPGRLQFYTGTSSADPSERMRITSNGSVLVDCTSLPGGSTQGFGFYPDTNVVQLLSASGSTSATAHAEFFNPNGKVGTITTDGTSTSYNQSSDYRLKENVVDLDGAIDRVKQLAPKRFNFIADANKTVDGFLAHETQAVVPEAVFGAKDAVDADGNPEYQGIDQSKLVPLLTAALQEAIGKIEALETRVAQLEGGAA